MNIHTCAYVHPCMDESQKPPWLSHSQLSSSTAGPLRFGYSISRPESGHRLLALRGCTVINY